MNFTSLTLGVLLVLSLSFPTASGAPLQPINKTYKIKHTKRDLDCLAKNIYFEARGEPVRGKIAVAQVTLNRVVHSSEFDKTICGVVYQKDQFSWTSDRKLTVKDRYQWEEAQHIARGILQGKLFLENFEALYFHANYVKPQWRVTKQYLKTIGKHVFYL